MKECVCCGGCGCMLDCRGIGGGELGGRVADGYDYGGP